MEKLKTEVSRKEMLHERYRSENLGSGELVMIDECFCGKERFFYKHSLYKPNCDIDAYHQTWHIDYI